jgi:hypothetical protein
VWEKSENVHVEANAEEVGISVGSSHTILRNKMTDAC